MQQIIDLEAPFRIPWSPKWYQDSTKWRQNIGWRSWKRLVPQRPPDKLKALILTMLHRFGELQAMNFIIVWWFLPSMCCTNYDFLMTLGIDVLYVVCIPAKLHGTKNYANIHRRAHTSRYTVQGTCRELARNLQNWRLGVPNDVLQFAKSHQPQRRQNYKIIQGGGVRAARLKRIES